MFIKLFIFMITHPKDVLRSMKRASLTYDGQLYDSAKDHKDNGVIKSDNRLRVYFDGYESGAGIWKWEHYLDIYDRYFSKFIGKNLVIAEIGVFSGGSLGMWKEYFVNKAEIWGIDIEPDCKNYEQDGVRVFIGDQSDPSFLRKITKQDKNIDILIDDGSHLPRHQIISFEEIFKEMNPGGVYICEDVHGIHNEFLDYVHGLNKRICGMESTEDKSLIPANDLQKWVKAIHVYPYCIVIEKSDAKTDHLLCTRKGTEWQPYSGKSKESIGSNIELIVK